MLPEPKTARGCLARRAAELRAKQEACDAAGEDEDCLKPVCEYDRFWNEGVEAFDSGMAIEDCPYQPRSDQQDDWLRGWLTAELDLTSRQWPGGTVASPVQS
ncbi:MAG TPA: Rmf/CrpP family protein [Pirellulales bacterium]|nr:Rmf/CrpP family protein [Pirellulales bacterium]